MEHTFFLKEPQRQVGNKPSLIIFSCYFKLEGKQFKYSTGEKIKPIHWSFEDNRPKLKGKNRDNNSRTIRTQLDRYSETFEFIQAQCKKMNEDFTSKILKDGFDKNFKKVVASANLFFDAYDEFMIEKQKQKEWKPSTVKRYRNIRNHLLSFQKARGFKITFSKINSKFYTEFTDYCYTDLKHGTNTYARNIGLFKTFMYWALDGGFTYNKSFIKFRKPERVPTEEIALNLHQVKTIFEFKIKSEKHQKVRDVFVFQCLTGLRYGELSLISRSNIDENYLSLKEEKDVNKVIRRIPLAALAIYILKKYDYNLPLITNQKQNKYIKEVFEVAGFIKEVEFSRTQNKIKETIRMQFKDRISTHTARRTFITLMKNEGIADKVIMEMTGHRDLKTFNTYYRPDDKDKKKAVFETFGSIEIPKLKKA